MNFKGTIQNGSVPFLMERKGEREWKVTQSIEVRRISPLTHLFPGINRVFYADASLDEFSFWMLLGYERRKFYLLPQIDTLAHIGCVRITIFSNTAVLKHNFVWISNTPNALSSFFFPESTT